MTDFTPTSRILRSKQAQDIIFKQSGSLNRNIPTFNAESEYLPSDPSTGSTRNFNVL